MRFGGSTCSSGRVLDALDRFPKGSVVLALSADHGFPVVPEAERQRNPSFRGGRLLTSDRAYPSFVERLNRLLALELCLDPQSRVLFGSDGFNIAYNRPAFPFPTVAGACGPEGTAVRAKDVDRVLPGSDDPVLRRGSGGRLPGLRARSGGRRTPRQRSSSGTTSTPSARGTRSSCPVTG